MTETITLTLFTLSIAISVGWLFMRWNVPGGMLVGAMLIFAMMQVLTGNIGILNGTKEVAQIIAGSFIGASLTLYDLKRLPRLWKAFSVIIIGLIILNVGTGLLIASVSNLSVITSLFATIPGGMGTIPIISSDYGADPIVVTVMQFLRMVMGVGVYPSLIMYLNQRFTSKEKIAPSVVVPEMPSSITSSPVRKRPPIRSGVALLFAGTMAWVFSQFLPGFNLMVLALIAMASLKLTIGIDPLPTKWRRIAQMLSGWYVGTQFFSDQLQVLINLIIPAMILVPTFLLGCMLIGYFVHRIQRMPLTDSMLASIPAGASDVVLILGDLNITNTDIVVLQVLRLITVTSIFPQLMFFIRLLLA